MTAAHLVILYGFGGLSDVGRHAVVAALERSKDEISKITVLTKHPKLLDESNWNCACVGGHGALTEEQRERVNVVALDDYSDIATHIQGATAVVSCLGNRQPFFGFRDACEGTTALLEAMRSNKIKRLVCMTSVGIAEDWPPMERHWSRWIMTGIFLTIGRPSFNDLSQMEKAVRADDDCDYLLVRPVGISEDMVPVNQWYIQKTKWEDAPYFNMAKLDVARFMVGEAIQPTRIKDAVVIGAVPPETST
ncbi:hypothetical protein MPSEU_000417500 [Mayamaea pseudoterrestris]|nr:hypothetical protein MPSEU_000417500 [Mayamaea pseudoterrestris]